MTARTLGAALIALTLQRESLPPAGTLAEHFDLSKPMTVSGIVHGINATPKAPYVFIAIAVDDADGNREVKWVVKGDTLEALRRIGWRFEPGGTIKPGDVVSVAVYPARKDSKLVEALTGTAAYMLKLVKEGRLVHGTEMTLPNGKKMYFGPSK